MKSSYDGYMKDFDWNFGDYIEKKMDKTMKKDIPYYEGNSY